MTATTVPREMALVVYRLAGVVPPADQRSRSAEGEAAIPRTRRRHDARARARDDGR